MNKFIILLISTILLNTGCSTYIANSPFYDKAVSNKAIERDGYVEYNRTVKVTPTKSLIPVVITNNNNQVDVKMLNPETIIAGGEAAAKIIIPIFKNFNDSYVDLRGAAQIEVNETYKHISN